MSEEALQRAEKRREAKGKEERYIYTQMNAEFQRIARRDKKAFLSKQCKDTEETVEWERLEVSSRKSEIPRELFIQSGDRSGNKKEPTHLARATGSSSGVISPCMSLLLNSHTVLMIQLIPKSVRE